MPNDQNIPYAFPSKGIDVAHAYDDQPQDTTREGVNVRLFEAQTERGRGGSRAGTTKFLPQAVEVGQPVQHLNTITWTTGEAVRSGGSGGNGIRVRVNTRLRQFRALQVKHGDSVDVTSDSRTILDDLPHPPIYPRDSVRTFVAYFSGTDNNGFSIYVE